MRIIPQPDIQEIDSLMTCGVTYTDVNDMITYTNYEPIRIITIESAWIGYFLLQSFDRKIKFGKLICGNLLLYENKKFFGGILIVFT